MVTCEFCGKEVSSTVVVRSAGSNLNACHNCKHLGNVVETNDLNPLSHSFRRIKKTTNTTFEVVQDYASQINRALANKGLNIKQLARVLNIKDTTLNKYCSGKIKPDVTTARKVESYFGIKLVEEVEAVSINEDDYVEKDVKGDESDMSLGDMLMKKLKEKEEDGN